MGAPDRPPAAARMDWIRAFRNDSQTELPALPLEAVPVLLVGSAPLLLSGMAKVIQKARGFWVCGKAYDAGSALDALPRLGPAIALVSLEPDDESLSLVPRLLALDPALRVVMLAHIEQRTAAERALRDGARGYVLVTLSADDLVDTLRRVAAGDLVLSDAVVDRLLLHLVERRPSGPPGAGTGLSARERKVLDLMGEGLGRSKISEHMAISVKTVDVYRQRLRAKLGIGSMAELYDYAADLRERTEGANQ